jgi:hypothetical protein
VERPAQAKDALARREPDAKSLDSIVEEALRATAPAEASAREGGTSGLGQPPGQAGQGVGQPILVLPPPGANLGQSESDVTRSVPRATEPQPEQFAPPPPEKSIKLPFPDMTGNR